MDTNIQTFWLEPTTKKRVWLRRYCSGSECGHLTNHGYHNAQFLVGDLENPGTPLDDIHAEPEPDHSDARWPVFCACGYKFVDQDAWQVFSRRLYARGDTGELVTTDDAPHGAVFDAQWLKDCPDQTGPDGQCIHVKVPNGALGSYWNVDSRASNCDSPCKWCRAPYRSHKKENCSNPGDAEHTWTKGSYEDGRPHKCWIRSGDPRLGTLHVDKNGVTCNAGAGSIDNRKWHGFLHNGKLTKC
jgi:hypothetical protein